MRLRVGLEPAGQAEGRGLAAGIRRRHGDDRHGLGFGPLLQLGVGDFARGDTGDDDDETDDCRSDGGIVSPRRDITGGPEFSGNMRFSQRA